jgi:hypothetical protein
MNLDYQKGHSLDELIQNLAETIAWCSSRPQPWSPLVSFRSIDIAPEFGSNDRKSWVDSVAKQRRRALGRGKHSLPERIQWWEGRLLVYFPMRILRAAPPKQKLVAFSQSIMCLLGIQGWRLSSRTTEQPTWFRGCLAK